MDINKFSNLLDGIGELCAKAVIVFHILAMLLIAICIREPAYRLLMVLLNSIFIALIIYFLKRYKVNDGNFDNLFNKDNLKSELIIYLKVYIKFLINISIVLIILGLVIEYK